MSHRVSGACLKAANAFVNLVIILSLTVAGVYAAYALWDNHRIYSAAKDVQADMIKFKPVILEDGGASFEELLAVNPDVCAWVTLDGTKIDYPILQGETNLTYINQDVYGNFSLAGSLFLDCRNDGDFKEPYSLIYGHHMEQSGMLGDLDLYKEESFFAENTTGTLLLPDRVYDLEIFACLMTDAADPAIFEPQRWLDGCGGIVDAVEEKLLHLNRRTADRLTEDENLRVLALSTCATDFTDARTVVLAVMVPR